MIMGRYVYRKDVLAAFVRQPAPLTLEGTPMPPDAIPEAAPQLVEYTCRRCGFKYHKQYDYEPYLCYRCMRYIAKHIYITMNTITPLGRTEREDI